VISASFGPLCGYDPYEDVLCILLGIRDMTSNIHSVRRLYPGSHIPVFLRTLAIFFQQALIGIPVADICTGIPCNNGWVIVPGSNTAPLHPLRDAFFYSPTRKPLFQDRSFPFKAPPQNRGFEKAEIPPVRPPPQISAEMRLIIRELSARHRHRRCNLPALFPTVVRSNKSPIAQSIFLAALTASR